MVPLWKDEGVAGRFSLPVAGKQIALFENET
jgi:hypothetical protein